MKPLKIKILIFTLLLLNSSNISLAQGATPESITKEFFSIYKTKETSSALNYLFSTNEFISKTDVEQISDKTSQYSNLLGEYYGVELFIKENMGETIEVHSYILKYERQPIRFILTFYKPNKEWKIYNFKISDDFISELESATIELAYKKMKE